MCSGRRKVPPKDIILVKISYWWRYDTFLAFFSGFGNQVKLIVLKLRKKRGKMCYEHICGRAWLHLEFTFPWARVAKNYFSGRVGVAKIQNTRQRKNTKIKVIFTETPGQRVFMMSVRTESGDSPHLLSVCIYGRGKACQ